MDRSKKYSDLMLNSKRGFSVVEGLIAAGMMSVVALSTVSLLYGLKKSSSPEAAVCTGYAQGILSRFRAVGQYPLIATYMPFGGARSAGTIFSLTSIQITDSNRWSNFPVIMDTSNPPILANYQLINSSVNAVMAVYNSASVNATICTAADGIDVSAMNDVGRLPVPQQLNQTAVAPQVFYKITPYDTLTGGAVGPCTRPLNVLPVPARTFPAGTGVAAAPGALITGGPLVQNVASARRNTGFLFRVTVNYQRKTETGVENDTCFSESRFQYEADQVPPQTPDRFTVSGGLSNPTVNDSNSYTVELGYTANRMKRGSVLVCRDRSMYTNAFTNAMLTSGVYNNAAAVPSPATAPCRVGGANRYLVLGSGAHQSRTPPYFPSTGPMLSNTTGLRYDAGAYTVTGAWGPCESVNACGVAPTSSALLTAVDSVQPNIRLVYSNLPRYCRIRIEVGVVDTSQNAVTNATTNVADAFPVTEPVTFEARDVNSPFNQCTKWCMANDSAAFPNGYWAAAGDVCPCPTCTYP